ncbi:hypothetical protein AO398_00675 [Methylobacterium sp. GXS13]|jgi:hypothetical protein|uniref:NIPSNAP family protein n=1 Tax=Methylobacterium sp. GXS13 TaxID=1730094 RepID=UPI00071BBDBB|nr:NIPSNAP family protein [Methylobacterium sp. GXS13]KST61233.1 hypothetical protein AO398_00675 [Methylobacterium sp. GXS13]
MHTLCLRHTIGPNRIDAFRIYVEDQTPVMCDYGSRFVRYYHSTDFASPTNVGYGLIEFETLAQYERYREVLAAAPTHRRHAAALTENGALLAIDQSFIRHRDYAEGSASA